ncbi:Sigma-54 interaction domain protein [uncultured Desulfobacterium sp.]|uniref:Sigma-54 interaction domain protein n=1 Tax=uncultured Desulfobacterium sp. TaxID=201089 RepID=A0A445MRJ9_9BACT|nr:Sigma-54 interaction domain protein [uncultured Desulfobacterium sp.]
MGPVLEILKQEGFLKNLFETIPWGVLIVDGERRVQAVNDVLERVLGVSASEVIDKRAGGALSCIHALKTPEGCGYAEECQVCRIRATALEAIDGKRIHRNEANVQLLINGKRRDLKLQLSAAPFEHEGKRMAIVILEDITELHELKRRLKTEQSFKGIIGHDANMLDLFETIREVSDVNVPVLILGESGTGKELVAAAIHNEGSRANKPFVPVNCGALPEGLLESELFGHVKGAFTGALRDKKGRFELADGGTLFLDEVADLSKVVQAKLLRVLQEGKFERVGDEKTISVDVRLISAANRDLKREVELGNFRDDLYYRINVVPIHLPPLRERRNDIPLLVEHFIGMAAKEGQKTAGISSDALAVMMDYPWPGNVRELQSTIRFALVKARGRMIRPEHLPAEVENFNGGRPASGHARKLDAKRVLEALNKAGGNKAKAARLLTVGRATLYRFLADNPEVADG